MNENLFPEYGTLITDVYAIARLPFTEAALGWLKNRIKELGAPDHREAFLEFKERSTVRLTGQTVNPVPGYTGDKHEKLIPFDTLISLCIEYFRTQYPEWPADVGAALHLMIQAFELDEKGGLGRNVLWLNADLSLFRDEYVVSSTSGSRPWVTIRVPGVPTVENIYKAMQRLHQVAPSANLLVSDA